MSSIYAKIAVPLADHRQQLPFAVVVLLLAMVLTGCTEQPESRPDDVPPGVDIRATAEPITMVLRPGESDVAHLTGRDLAAFPVDISIAPTNEVSAGAPQACLPLPDLLCERRAFSATDRATANILSQATLNDPIFPTLPVTVFPSDAAAAPPAIRIAAGRGKSFAVTAFGDVWAWGRNDEAQLGLEDPTRNRAVPERLNVSGVRFIVSGLENTFAVRNDGTILGWGKNSSGQLATGHSEEVPQPVELTQLRPVLAIASGDQHSLFLYEDGTVWAAGSNSFGQLGIDDESGRSRETPVQVVGLDSVVAVAAGSIHSLALRDDGSVWAWGSNARGQIGTGSLREALKPTRVERLSTFDDSVAIAANDQNSFALRSDGTVWAFGDNTFGTLGAPSTPGSRVPVPVVGLDNVVQIAAGNKFGVALRANGSVWAWGTNFFGELGGLPGFARQAAQPIEGLDNVLMITVGGSHGLALSANDGCDGFGGFGGRLLAWGHNLDGERGDGTGVTWPRPTPVLTLGDGSACATSIGSRLIIYKTGPGSGTLESSEPGLKCAGMICWQTVSPLSPIVRLTAIPDAGSEFSEWRWDCAGAAPSTTVDVSSVRHCKAYFDRGAGTGTFDLSISTTGSGQVTSSPSGIDCGADCSETYAAGTVVGLSAESGSGWTFNGFSGDADCADGAVTMDADTSCNAEFTQSGAGVVMLSVTVIGPNGDEGLGRVTDIGATTNECTLSGGATRVDCEWRYIVGSNVTLEGENFVAGNRVDWVGGCDNGTGELQNNRCNVSMSRDREVLVVME